MKHLSIAFGACLLALLPASSALADTFDFSLTGTFEVAPFPGGPTFSGSGTFTATPSGTPGVWTITDVTGTIDGISIAAGNPLSTDSFQGNDNLLLYPGTFGFNGPDYFTDGGVSFVLSNGDDINLNDTLGFENAVAGNGYIDLFELDHITITDVGSTPSVPEPGTLAMMGTGIVGLAGALRRRLSRA